MNLVDLFFLLVAGTSVGIMFSLIVYESNSIWLKRHGPWCLEHDRDWGHIKHRNVS